jgi:putative phosphoribosyl transferase
MNGVCLDLDSATAATVKIIDGTWMEAELIMPRSPNGVVLLIHGYGSTRLNPRSRFVARMLREGGLGTLLLDTETPDEIQQRMESGGSAVDSGGMASRILLATEWLQNEPPAAGLPIGYLGADACADAALIAASERPDIVRGIVSRGGRPELSESVLARIKAPTLLIVGAHEVAVVHQNRVALDMLGSTEKRLEIIPGALHSFEEPGALAAVAMHASRWLARYLPFRPTVLPPYAVVL